MKNARNLAANLTAFVVTFAISFLLSPFIVRTLGVEANGLIALANNFLSQASILVLILSSMFARFITIEVRAGNDHKASEYYTASYAGDLIGAAILLPVMVITVVNFGNWFDVPHGLVADAQLMAALLFASFLLRLVLPRWSVGTWATNNLHLDSLRTMQSVLLRGGLILLLFVMFDPAVAFVGLATLASTIFATAFSGYYKRRLLPDVRIRPSLFRWSRLGEIVVAGFWNSVNHFGNLLTTGFHVLLANLFLGATVAGRLALAMTVPAMVTQLSSTLSNVFSPSLAFAYAESDHSSMLRQTRRAMSITSLLTMMPLGALIVLGETFFSLWVPSEDAAGLGAMSVAAAAGLVFACSAQPLLNVFVTTNTQRPHSTASAVLGLINVALSVLLLTVTPWGTYAILASAAATVSIRVLIFTVPMAGRQMRATWSAFLPEIARCMGYLIVLVLVGYLVQRILSPSSWFGFFLSVGITCVGGTLINVLLLTSPADRNLIFDVARRLWRRKG